MTLEARRPTPLEPGPSSPADTRRRPASAPAMRRAHRDRASSSSHPAVRVTAPDDSVERAAESRATAFEAGSTAGVPPHSMAAARVRVDRAAAESARQHGALAYTIGTDIYFGEGAYAPDTGAGRHLIAHELAHVAQAFRGAVPAGLVMRQIADRLEYDNLAERIHKAIAGLGTDEAAVYLALQQLERDPTAIGRLEARYLARYGVTLQADIEDDFSLEELEYALQLLGRGTQGSAQAIGAAPTNPADIQTAARRLRAAMDIIGTDEEAIYAVLRPFGRDLRLLEDLRLAYAALSPPEDLRSRIIDEMSGEELDYALYLLGGAPIRAQPEITEMTPAQATTIFGELAAMTLWTTTFERSPIPFHYPPDGCYARAQLMADRLTELGFASEKVFAIARTPAGAPICTSGLRLLRTPRRRPSRQSTGGTTSRRSFGFATPWASSARRSSIHPWARPRSSCASGFAGWAPPRSHADRRRRRQRRPSSPTETSRREIISCSRSIETRSTRVMSPALRPPRTPRPGWSGRGRR